MQSVKVVLGNLLSLRMGLWECMLEAFAYGYMPKGTLESAAYAPGLPWTERSLGDDRAESFFYRDS